MTILIFTISYLAMVTPVALGDRLDQVLASAIFPSSPFCHMEGSSTFFSFNFTSTADISHWDINTAQFEEDVFQVDMVHTDNATERSWILRIGKGGQIASFVVSAGEAIANQAISDSVWNDLVQQMVSVNGNLNSPLTPNFVHQAGPYMRDTGMPPPFFSPMVALDCAGNYCSAANWGQQAHVPTAFDSPLLYYTRYCDAGDGVIQVDLGIHHFGQVSTDIYDYFNTPWTAVRTSTFHDMMIADGSGKLQHEFPLKDFGPSIVNLDETGGFTTFAEDLELASDMFDFGFCVDTTKRLPETADVPCDALNGGVVPFRFQVQESGTVWETGHWEVYGCEKTVSMRLCDLQAPVRIGYSGWGNPYDGVLLVNDRTGFTFQSDFIIHYCWEDQRTYLSSNVTAAVLNQEFLAGDTISIFYVTSGKPFDNQTALTFVHGRNPEYDSGMSSFYRAKSRMRFGTTNNRRDGTVWTTNLLGTVSPSDTYLSRKFVITDKLDAMESAAASLVDETYEDVLNVFDLPPGETITLWFDQDSFGASIGLESCNNARVACLGTSVPLYGARPLFYIECGNDVVTTFDPYYFSLWEGPYRKPYLCVNDTIMTRAEWKLLGYFPSGDCLGSLLTQRYESTFCESPPTTTTTAASLATNVPTTVGTSLVDTSAPTELGTASPSWMGQGSTTTSPVASLQMHGVGKAPLDGTSSHQTVSRGHWIHPSLVGTLFSALVFVR